MPNNPAAIAADREAGTPGPWIAFKPSYYWNIRTGDDTPFPDQLVCDVMESSAIYANSRAKPVDHGAANARRIARVPELEEAYLAEHAARIAAEAERDRFEAALGRACLVGATTHLVERAEAAEAEVKRLRTFEGLEANLRSLLNGQYSSLSISFNDAHAPNYATAQTYHDEYGQYGATDPEEDEWVSPEEKAKALENNSVWTAQWYPDTPVGFYIIRASSLHALMSDLLRASAPVDERPGAQQEGQG